MSEELLALTFARPSPHDAGRLAQAAREHLVLSTCERFEIYLADATAPPSMLAPSRVRRGADAARHLFRVAAGLESRLVGEPQILGQLRAAFLAGAVRRSLGPVLSALARSALHAGRRARCETGLGRAPTIVTLTLARLSQQLGGLRRRAVLVAGTGALAAEIAQALRAAGAGRLYVLSREQRRANALAARVAGVGLGDADLLAIPPLDAVVACSDRRVPLAAVAAASGPRVQRLAIVDLGAPPNVALTEPELAAVSLTRLGELGAADASDDSSRRSAIAAAEQLLERELERFLCWRRARALHGAAAARRTAA